MNDDFQKTVRAAAIAGWWTLLVAVLFIWLQWLAYLFLMNARPEWIKPLWGPDISWSFVQTVWFWFTTIFKLCVSVLVLLVVWLTLWARQLRKKHP